MALHVVGVRHHSPACAKLVAHVIARARPKHVLIEGPSDMNARIDELLLAHTLPIAVFSYLTKEGQSRSSWSPFCAYSPEWVALKSAREVGAEARFMDLPAWHDAFWEVKNRYSDRHVAKSAPIEALCERLNVEGHDALWDHLFEQPIAPDELAARLMPYFAEIRAGDEAGSRDVAREAVMARFVAWAMNDAKDRDVVVVCGGYHAPYLERAWKDCDGVMPDEIAVPADARAGSYLVPYSSFRLDSFTGYDSGMPSPAFYQAVWDAGHVGAGETMMRAAIARLRKKKQRVSPADLIAASTLAHALATLRGHAAMARIDLLDGLAGALIKDALDAPLPWTRRGRLAPGTAPVLVEIVAAMSGDLVGVLAKETPRPPLVDDAHRALEEVEVVPVEASKAVAADLADARGLARSRVLHRLRVLGIPGFALARPLAIARGGSDLTEGWKVQRVLETDPALIEAAAYGSTLASAAQAKLEEALKQARDLGRLAAILYEAARIGVPAFAAQLMEEVQATVNVEPSLESLGGAVANLFSLWKYDSLLGAAGARDIGAVLAAAFERGLWLFEGISGEATQVTQAHVDATAALRALVRDAAKELSLDVPRAHAMMKRRAATRDAPPTLRGAALGFLWSTGAFVAEGEAESLALAAVKAAAAPKTVGDFLAGLFALAREEVVHATGLISAIDLLVVGMDDAEFLVAVPALRLAFSYFPPVEKERIAQRLLEHHGGDTSAVRTFLKLEAPLGAAMAGLAIDAQVDAIAKRYGLDDEVRET